MLKFGFINFAAEREYKDLPEEVQDTFGRNLRNIQFGNDPTLPITHLQSVGNGVIELKINGSPAFRCLYVTKFMDTVIVIHSFTKTTNGTDRQALQTAETRLKSLIAELKSNPKK